MPKTRRVIVVDNSAVARRIGDRIREARTRAGLKQADLARGRYTPAYISALERGLAKPSMAALSFISERLGVSPRELFGEDGSTASRLEADLLLASGQHEEALDRYNTLLEAAAAPRARAEILRGMAEALCRLGRGEETVRLASEAAEIFDAQRQPADAALARYWLAYAHYLQDNPAEARSLLQELLGAVRSGLEVAPDFRFRLLAGLGMIESWDGKPEQAIAYMEEARALIGEMSIGQRAAFLSGLALQYRQAGDLERSIRAGMESLALYRSLDAVRDEAALEINMGLSFVELGNLRPAVNHVRRARELAGRLDDPRLDSQVAEAEAQLAMKRGDDAAAEERLAHAIGAMEHGGSWLAAVGAYVTRARMQAGRGDEAGAQGSFEAAARILRDHRSASRLRALLAEWAELRTRIGDLAGANRLYAEALGRTDITEVRVRES
jgi:transcriptional regulator with XRE-family HTH domain